MLGGRLGLRPLPPTRSRAPLLAPSTARPAPSGPELRSLHDVIRIGRHHDVGPGPGPSRPSEGRRVPCTVPARRQDVSQLATTFDAHGWPSRRTISGTCLLAKRSTRSRESAAATVGALGSPGNSGSRPGIGQDRPAECSGETADRFGPSGVRTCQDHALYIGGASAARTSSDAGSGPLLTPPILCQPLPLRRPGGGSAAETSSGSRNARFVCDRTGAHRSRYRLGDEAAPERSPARSRLVVGHPGVNRPPERPSEDPGLLHRLRGADVMELRGAVGSADDERHPCQVGFHDGSVGLDSSRTARRHEHRRPARSRARSRARRMPPTARRDGRAGRCGRHGQGPRRAGSNAIREQITASVRPARTHSSTSVAAKQAATVDPAMSSREVACRRDPPSSPGCMRPQRGEGPTSGARSRVHSDRPDRGSASPVTSNPASRSSPVDLPGHGRSPIPGAGSDLDQSRPWRSARRGARRATSATRWGDGAACSWRSPARAWSRASCSSRAPRHLDEPARRAASRPTTSWPTTRVRPWWRPTGHRREFRPAWVTRPDLRGRDERAGLRLEERARNTAPGWRPACDWPGPAPDTPRWTLGALGMPVLVVTGANDAKFTGLGSRMVHAIGRTPPACGRPGSRPAPTCDSRVE